MYLPRVFLCFVAAATSASAGSPKQQKPMTQPILFAGTFTRDEGWVNGTGKGIYTYKLDTSDGSLTPWAVTPVGINPIYVQGTTRKFNTGQRVIYAVNSVDEEVPAFPGKYTGYVSALTLNNDGTLKVLNTRKTLGGSSTHISLSPKEDFVVVSNYGGSLTMFPINEDGSLGSATFFEEYLDGSNVFMERQTMGHIHSSTWLPNSDHVVVANLGSDELLQYDLDTKKRTLKSLKAVRRPPGSGPRHMEISSEGKIAYVVDELSNTVGVYKINQKGDVLSTKSLQDITTLPRGYKNSSTSADIHLSSNGKFLYTSNRGHDSIAMFKIDKEDGTLAPLGWESTRGEAPRGFTVYDKWLIVANQNSSDMFVFEVDSDTGLLSYTGNSYEIGTAVCLYVAEY
uniref:6-phosphogluconolactonase n=1 Tax=Peronospora matthiolae TaxID=2874970 RepID=A0AAV1UZE2_9STRA